MWIKLKSGHQWFKLMGNIYVIARALAQYITQKGVNMHYMQVSGEEMCRLRRLHRLEYPLEQSHLRTLRTN
jgi:hypothetical protein